VTGSSANVGIVPFRIRRKRQRLPPNPPIASAPARNNLIIPDRSAPERLSIGY